jgi:hypothetical protein
MTLHAKATGDRLDSEQLSVNPLYTREGESTSAPPIDCRPKSEHKENLS